jgi:hypothetical protein
MKTHQLFKVVFSLSGVALLGLGATGCEVRERTVVRQPGVVVVRPQPAVVVQERPVVVQERVVVAPAPVVQERVIVRP